MKRDFLKAKGLDEETINEIMAENGKDINAAKGESEKLAAELQQTKEELQKANATLENVKDYDNVKADVEKYKKEAAQSKAEYEKKLEDMELTGKIKDFTASKKFVNELTRDAINAQLKAAVNAAENKGKSYDELLNGITEGKENIFMEENTPTPPVTPNMQQGNGDAESGVLAAFKRLNPNIQF